VDDPRVLFGRVQSGSSEKALFVNCSRDGVVLEPIVTNDVELRLPAGPLTLEPLGVAVVPCEHTALAGQSEAAFAPAPVAATAEGGDARI
jgi:hypothetical protein